MGASVNIRTCLRAAVLTIAIWSAPATANAAFQYGPSDPVIHDAATVSAVAFARDWWGVRDVRTACAIVTPKLYDDSSDPAYARAFGTDGPPGWSCTIWIQAAWRREAFARTKGEDVSSGMAMYCRLMLHEYGHVSGLQHTARGVMSPDISPGDAPAACWRWARRMATHRPA